MLSSFIRFAARLTLGSAWNQVCNQIERECEEMGANPGATPPLLAQMLLVSGEDRRHGRHPGFDMHAIGRALWRRVVHGRREGASTIEQQVVRVLTCRFERSLGRKMREILLASLVAEVYPKSLLPSLYLRIGYYGWRMTGFEEACRRLRLCPTSMSLGEAAALVARLKYPEPRIPPGFRIDQIRRRRDYLTRLHFAHLKDGTYEHLHPRRASAALRNCPSVVAAARVLPAT